MLVIGTDEAGRGPLAGPVVAAAVVFDEGYKNERIKDSKKLSAKQREGVFQLIKAECIEYSIVAVGHRRIEQHNILGASLLAMSLAVKRLRGDIVLIDGNQRIQSSLPQETVIGGDDKIIQISAASILAKVWRDQLMKMLDQRYPGYMLSVHAGYPTKSHRERISTLGPSPIHRRSFTGVREFWHMRCGIDRSRVAERTEHSLTK